MTTHYKLTMVGEAPPVLTAEEVPDNAPERKLLQAALLGAYDALIAPVLVHKPEKSRNARLICLDPTYTRDAIYWFRSPAHDWYFDYLTICDILGIDQRKGRRQAERLVSIREGIKDAVRSGELARRIKWFVTLKNGQRIRTPHGHVILQSLGKVARLAPDRRGSHNPNKGDDEEELGVSGGGWRQACADVNRTPVGHRNPRNARGCLVRADGPHAARIEFEGAR